MTENWDYLTAWLIYLGAGVGMLHLLWRITSSMRSIALRDLIRWIMVVLIFTPWSAGTVGPFLAPATSVLLFDLLLTESKTGMVAGVALLALCGAVVVLLTIRLLWQRRGKRESERSQG